MTVVLQFVHVPGIGARRRGCGTPAEPLLRDLGSAVADKLGGVIAVKREQEPESTYSHQMGAGAEVSQL